jgi:hypothetical protein
MDYLIVMQNDIQITLLTVCLIAVILEIWYCFFMECCVLKGSAWDRCCSSLSNDLCSANLSTLFFQKLQNSLVSSSPRDCVLLQCVIHSVRCLCTRRLINLILKKQTTDISFTRKINRLLCSYKILSLSLYSEILFPPTRDLPIFTSCHVVTCSHYKFHIFVSRQLAWSNLNKPQLYGIHQWQ